MNRAFALIAMAGLAVAPLRNSAQDLAEDLKDGTLAVKVHALVPGAAGAQGTAIGWQEESVKYTVPGLPVGVKLLGTNVVIMTQVTPFDRGDDNITLVAQGQVWVRGANGSISYRTTLETVTVPLGETVLFYPLGIDAAGKYPLRIEISVNRRRAGEAVGQAQPKDLAQPHAAGIAPVDGQKAIKDLVLPPDVAPPPPGPTLELPAPKPKR